MGAQWRMENPNPRVHSSSGKLGEPRFPLERVGPRVGIFLSPLDTHDGFYLHVLFPIVYGTTSMYSLNIHGNDFDIFSLPASDMKSISATVWVA